MTHTPGSWAWFGSNHGIYLATEHSGRQYVMGFRRMGMHRAQPEFQSDGRLIPAADLVEFSVGDGRARGFAEGKANPSVYRYDITGIDHPDARLIAAAPDMLAALEEMVETFHGYQGMELTRARAAIAKATGEGS